MMDAALGSLPTLIVPDDPETGAIERPATPPPVEVDESRLVQSHSSARRLSVEAVPSTHSPRPTSKAPSVHGNTPREVEMPVEEPIVIEAIAPLEALAPHPPPPSSHSGINSKDYKTMAKRAAALAKQDRLAGGNKSVFDANMSDIGELGIGMQLYFMLTKYLGIVFLIMGIVSLPAITVNNYGHGVTSKMADPLQLAYASLGNQGVSDDVKADTSLCQPEGDIDCTWETVKTPFTTSPVTVSWIITSSDAIYSFVFLVFVIAFRVRARRAIDKHQQENLTPAKYAVFVRGLPRDATAKEILDHFNERFDPTQEETYFPLWLGCCWGKRRRRVKHSLSKGAVNCNVVANVEHLNDAANSDMYLGTWIAEVSVARPTGGLLRTFLSMEALTRSVADTNQLIAILERDKREAAALEAKAATLTGIEAKKIKKEAARVFRPADDKLLQVATVKLARLSAQLEKKTGKIKAFKQQQHEKAKKETKPKTDAKADTKADTKIDSKTDVKADAKTDVKTDSKTDVKAENKPAETDVAMPSVQDQPAQGKLNVAAVKKAATATVSAFDLDACEAAFVVFNNLESRRRCLRDYRRSTQWLPHKFQPKQLRFRDKFPLIVVAAPEPSNILWENLEITDRGRLYRRSFTNLITFLLLLFSCGIISGAQSAQQQFKAKMPPSGLCDSSLPAVFFGNTSFDTGANAKLDWELAWSPNATCPAGTNGETQYHIAYTNGIVNPLSIAHPTSTTGVRCTDPCVSDASSTTCSTLPCFDQDLLNSGESCETYLASHVLYCLCTGELQNYISEKGFLDGPQALWKDVLPCRGFIKDYLTKNAFIALASGIVVVVNLLLKAVLRALAGFERHSSESSRASALALKMFLAQFLNTAVIVLIVNAALHLDKVPLARDLFKGKYRDFERDWYPTVGMAITMTMLINAFVPHLVLGLQMFVLAPLKRCVSRRSIRSQEQMNKLYAGPPFDLAVRYPLVLNSVIVTMLFSGGSPVLLFIAALTCGGTFWLDKLSILRLYSVKTAYDEALGEVALSLLPWALVLHLGFSSWMYGNPNLMKSTTINLGFVFSLLGLKAGDGESSDSLYSQLLTEASSVDVLGQYGFVVKIVRANVMVMVLFCAITIAGILLSTLWLQVALPVLRKTLYVVLAAIWSRVKCSCHCLYCCARRRKRVQPTTTAKPATKGNASRSTKVAVDNAPHEEAWSKIDQPPAAESAPIVLEEVEPPEAVIQPEVTEPMVTAEFANPNSTTEPVATAESTPATETVPTLEPSPTTEATPTAEITPTTEVKSPVEPSLTPATEPAAETKTDKQPTPPVSARRAPPEVVLPEFTDVFRKSVPSRFRPDKQLGFTLEPDSGELVRRWKEETISNGRTRTPGEQMRTWEALQAPVKTYSIEANAKYRIAFAELAAAAKRSRSASAVLNKADLLTLENIEDVQLEALDIAAPIGVEPPAAAVEATEPEVESPDAAVSAAVEEPPPVAAQEKQQQSS